MDAVINCLTLAVCLALAAKQYHVEPALLAAVISAESGGNRFAVSKAGAQGLMQLMPATAAGLGVTDSFAVSQSVQGGAAYLAIQRKRFGGSVPLGLASYNAGPGAVIKAGGIPQNGETPRYVGNVMSTWGRFVQARAAISVRAPQVPLVRHRASAIGTAVNPFKATSW